MPEFKVHFLSGCCPNLIHSHLKGNDCQESVVIKHLHVPDVAMAMEIFDYIPINVMWYLLKLGAIMTTKYLLLLSLAAVF